MPPSRDCTQVCLSLETSADGLHIVPIKVWGRYSERMFHSHRVTADAAGQLSISPLPLARADERAHADILDAKNRELAAIRDAPCTARNEELAERNHSLAQANAQLAEQSRLYRSLRANLDSLQSAPRRQPGPSARA